VRVERLKEFCDFVGQQYKDILGYSNVRWLSLLPAMRRICELYPALQSFFISEEKCPVLLKKWFSDPCSQLWLNFVNSTLPLFHDAIRKVEAQEVTSVESCMIDTQLFKRQTECKEGGKFYSSVSQGTSVFLRRRWFILKKSVFKCIT
jgi:hypothetical protein